VSVAHPIRTLATLPLVLTASALALRAADEVGVRARGYPRGVTRHARLDQAEARIAGRLLLPAYFPDDLEWPPFEILSAGAPAAVCLGFRGRADAGVRTRLCQAAPGRDTIPALLLSPEPALSEQLLTVHDEPALLQSFRGRDGETWRDLTLVAQGRRVVLRSRDSADRMLRLAASLRPGRP
jgi:hypothetical protein